MSFIIDGVEMEKVVINGVEMDALYIDNELVYSGKAPPGEQIFEADGVFVVPKGCTEVTVCMIGGGGSGGLNHDQGFAGGGYSGVIFSNIISVIAGENIPIIIGIGGAGLISGSIQNGNAGTKTSFGTTEVNGGAGGSKQSKEYNGDGGSRTTCYGTFSDGTIAFTRNAGGQAGFADGGDGSYNRVIPYHGAKGSGGGSNVVGDFGATGYSGAGGNGLVRISWS